MYIIDIKHTRAVIKTPDGRIVHCLTADLTPEDINKYYKDTALETAAYFAGKAQATMTDTE